MTDAASLPKAGGTMGTLNSTVNDMNGTCKTFNPGTLKSIIADKIREREQMEKAAMETDAAATAAASNDYHYGAGPDSTVPRRHEHLMSMRHKYQEEARRAAAYQKVRALAPNTGPHTT